MKPGVYQAKKKDRSVYYRASITYKGKHISLGSYRNEMEANRAYTLAQRVLSDSRYISGNYPPDCVLSFHKWIVLINFRDNKIYFKNPIYLKKKYFLYYIDRDMPLRFDADDLFFYARHKIMKRGGHLFVTEYGMQNGILSRYGVKSYAVAGRDYVFANGDSTDYRYGNIEVINRYHGVSRVKKNGLYIYLAKIHINGDYLVGRYRTDYEAAVAYNKATHILRDKGFIKKYPENYVEGIDEIGYASIYQRIRISKKLYSL